MYIEPSTNIRILKSVPLDNTYKHTLYFANVSTQTNFFLDKTKHNLTQQTYQRKEAGVARVGINAESLYDCNYMMFQNTHFGTKWFYAFITGVEYINNVVSEITFEIDVMQTWYFDYKLQHCYVEREHTLTDNIGDNLVTEPVDLGAVICSSIKGTDLLSAYVAVVAVAEETPADDTTGTA